MCLFFLLALLLGGSSLGGDRTFGGGGGDETLHIVARLQLHISRPGVVHKVPHLASETQYTHHHMILLVPHFPV